MPLAFASPSSVSAPVTTSVITPPLDSADCPLGYGTELPGRNGAKMES